MVIDQFKTWACLISCIGLCSCGAKVDRLQSQFLSSSKQEPALSGNGEKLALIVDYKGRSTIQLRDLRTGNIVPLRHLSRNQPHSSPSISWNARYVAVIAQRGNRRLAIIEDRLTGRHHQIPLPGERTPVRISLAPDGRRLAVQVADKGKWRIELFDLTQKIEPDNFSGSRVLENSEVTGR